MDLKHLRLYWTTGDVRSWGKDGIGVQSPHDLLREYFFFRLRYVDTDQEQIELKMRPTQVLIYVERLKKDHPGLDFPCEYYFYIDKRRMKDDTHLDVDVY